MKSLLTVLAALFLTGAAVAQGKWEYCEVLSYLGTGFTKKAAVEVVFGDTELGWGKKANLLKDSTGAPIKFKTHVEALDHMGASGWETILSYIEELPGDMRQVHFLLRRRYE